MVADYRFVLDLSFTNKVKLILQNCIRLGFGVRFGNVFDGGKLSLAKGDTFYKGNLFIKNHLSKLFVDYYGKTSNHYISIAYNDGVDHSTSSGYMVARKN